MIYVLGLIKFVSLKLYILTYFITKLLQLFPQKEYADIVIVYNLNVSVFNECFLFLNFLISVFYLQLNTYYRRNHKLKVRIQKK